ncbi:flagellin [Nocardioides panacis]|uniref:Flagellin n=1 Tax=Nocardioides panacis TaxID=2849501 RepID=A0A975Y0H5_9ACTN|nr:flagellin [Nocardioides panacis]QWZ08481.1 flagellin [Nocardioides panacis]
MSLRINQNIAAMNAYRNLSVTDGQMAKSLEKLSSGFRINRAADDAAGLAISEGLRSQVGGLKVAVRNTQDGISVVQTAEGALTETHSILQRMRDLAVQGSNDGGLDANAKSNIQSEMGQLKDELDRIAKTTTFNGSKLLDGNYTGTFQVGANAGETISVGIGSSNKGMDASGLGIAGVDVTKLASGAGTVAAATHADPTSTTAGSVTTTSGGLNVAGAKLNGSISVGGKTLDLSSIQLDTTVATNAAANVTKINAALDGAFGAGKVVASTSTNDLKFTGSVPASASTSDIANADVVFTGQSGASAAITSIDKAIQTVSTTRANLGAVQNRFEHTVNNLNVAVENLSASESRIRDTDMASEMVNFTRSQILSQAGTAMLAQANQASQGVLRLLQ